MLFTPLLWLPLLAVLIVGTTEARLICKNDIHNRQAAAALRYKPTFASLASVKLAAPKNITFSNPKASRMCLGFYSVLVLNSWGIEFYVDGRSIPEVDFDVGPSWAGLLPISGKKNETRKVGTIIVNPC